MKKKLNLRLVLAGSFFVLLVVLAIFAPLIAPHNPLEQDLMFFNEPPMYFSAPTDEFTKYFFLGSDSLGRDLLSRIIYGSQITLIVAISASLIACIVGSLLGLLAGYYGGKVDAIISRIVDVWMSFPPILLSILLVAVMGTGLYSVIFAIAVIDWTRFCRTVRAETLKQKTMDYIDSAQIMGRKTSHILFKEIFPNVLPSIIVLFTLEMAIAVVVETILSFVGLSISSDTPTWGSMIAEGREVIYHAWWILAFPLLILFLTISAFSQLGEGIKIALDPLFKND